MRRVVRCIPLLTIMTVSACTWVKTAPGADQVALKNAQDVVACKYLGTATGKTKDSLVFKRNSDKVATEVLTLARNEAFSQGGNAVVPKGGVVNGVQTFAIYQCP
ncbi:DUF4156 domain-containing protein [Aestuariicella hydrocarbonica]|uniref:DUF4156 domain-containing protein n=1 Tax=Pseudomaricurvus hydrocarbonicus TaxID=1470433 RepID=A0A9E5MPK6_9GAMM|nr:DUF4156 domain-containing protein [Aestuariicella hydrocarbonica]NHO68035.1 DUF4156 domain-containing protein [Aestuariicella hydrocarbonica]